jgi:hypothetical protein
MRRSLVAAAVLAPLLAGCGRAAAEPPLGATEASGHAEARAAEVPRHPPVAAAGAGAEAPRYPSVAAVFATHCGACHDKRRGDNAAAQRVFESSSYPFATERTEGLLGDLREMFEQRKSIPEAERAAALAWIAGGGLDHEGKAPPYR